MVPLKFIFVLNVTSHHFSGLAENPNIKTCIHKQQFSSACERYVLLKTKLRHQAVEDKQIYI